MAFDFLIPKLAILQYLETTRFELTAEQLSRVFLENGWAEYFVLKQALGELVESAMVRCTQRPQGKCFSIAPAGRETLRQFHNRLPYSLRQQIEAFAQSSHFRIQNETQNLAACRRLGPGEYEVECQIIENERVLLSLRLNVASAELAASLANRWTENAPSVYSALWSALTEAPQD